MNHLIWYAGLYSVSAALLKLAGFVLFLWLARILPVADYATFGLFYALQVGVITFALAGVVEAVVGQLRGHRSVEQRRVLFATGNTAFLLLVVAVCVLALLVFWAFLGQSDIRYVTFFYVLVSGVLLAFASFQAQIVRLDEKHLSSLCFSFVAPLAGLGGGAVVFLVNQSVKSFFLGSVVGVSIALIVLWVVRIGVYDIAARISDTRAVFLTGAPFIAIAFLGWLSGYGNNYVVNILFESIEVARFTFAFTLSSIMQLIASALNQAWSPRFYRITHELPFEEVESKNRLFFRVQGVTLGFVGGIVIAVFPSAVNALGGNLVAYASMKLELCLLFSSYVLLSPWWHCQNYYLAYGNGKGLMRVVLITSVIGVAVWFLLMWLLGPIGIYVGFMAQMFLRTIGVVIAARRYWPVNVSWGGVAGGLLMILGGFALSEI